MRWFLPAIPTLNPPTLLHTPFVPHIQVALCHLPSMHFPCSSPATAPSALLPTPAGLPVLSSTAWSPLPLSLPWSHPAVSTAECDLPPSNPDFLQAFLLWSFLISTLYFGDLCTLLGDISSFLTAGMIWFIFVSLSVTCPRQMCKWLLFQGMKQA